MEFRFDINNLMVNEIVRVDNTLILPQWRSSTRNRLEFQQLYEIINAIGESSAFAQSLNRIITTSDKLQNSDHLLYLMKEVENARTVVVGMLKVGRKKLFVLNPSGDTKEVAPLCVLDFYIHESRQRRGYGRKLFDYMLRDQNITPGHMAVDKPSDKFVLFLQRHYGLSAQVAQINNFVIYADFFMDRPVSSDESAMTYVSRSNRSSRGVSPSASPALSPSASRRGSATPAQYAGKPSRSRETNMSEILHGRADRHTVGARMTTPRHQNTLEWMRGASSGGDSPYYSRTPSYSGTPVASRTPREASPLASGPPTPPRGRYAPPTASASAVARKLVIEQDKMDGPESIAPTPATSPAEKLSSAHTKTLPPPSLPLVKGEQAAVSSAAVARENGAEMVELNGKLEHMSVAQTPAEGKTGSWRDSVSRDSTGLVEHMCSAKTSSMGGVLSESDSVHGHLKFHHHALW